jgi:hypothetical protein
MKKISTPVGVVIFSTWHTPGRGVRDQPGGLANSEAFHVVVGARPSQQDFRRKGAVIKDAAHQRDRLGFSRAGRQAAIEGTQCGIGPPNRHGGKPQQGGGPIAGHRPQNRRSVLQHASARYVLCRSWRDILRRALQATCPRQPPPACEVSRVCFASGGSGPHPGGCFLGNLPTCWASR